MCFRPVARHTFIQQHRDAGAPVQALTRDWRDSMVTYRFVHQMPEAPRPPCLLSSGSCCSFKQIPAYQPPFNPEGKAMFFFTQFVFILVKQSIFEVIVVVLVLFAELIEVIIQKTRV